MKERILSDVKEVAEGRGSMHGSLLEIIPIARKNWNEGREHWARP